MSNGANALALLARERENILLAELGAFFHNLGKLSLAFHAYQRCRAGKELALSRTADDLQFEAFNYQAIAGLVAEHITAPWVTLTTQDWQRLESSAEDWLEKATNRLLPESFRQRLQQRNIQLPPPLNDRNYAIGDFIEFQAYKWYSPQASGQRIRVIFPGGSKATELVDIAHDAASGTEKEGAISGLGLQYEQPLYRATVFGYETPIDEGEIELARENFLSVASTLSRTPILQSARKRFALGVGDTRRTINDVSLWDLSASTASFYKAAVARVVLDNQWVARGSFEWRLLHIRFDGLSFLERAPTISDLIGRRAALQAALDDVQHLLEVTYPLGNEVYRDENGSAFVMPALDGDDTDGNRLRDLIESHILEAWKQSELGRELRPQIHITKADQQAAILHEALATHPPAVSPFQDSLSDWWQGEAADVCTACGVRPQGWGAPNDNQKRKAQDRNVCYVCLERRGRRAQIWAQARHKTDNDRKPWERTIWLDEVASRNGRLALVVGKFDLTQWLNGDMVQTLLVVCDKANNTYEPKNPSFARLQRVWRTTQQFWQTVQDNDIPNVTGLNPQYRLAIAVNNGAELSRELGDYHAYEAEINGRRLSVVWDSQDRLLLTADNLLTWTTEGTESLINQLPEEMPLLEPGGYGQRRSGLQPAKIDKQRSEVFSVPYAPTIALLTEPNAFMALVPATSALPAATRIAQRYELEMSKVHNRLPLFLGLVFLDRRQPLFSALDAGRRLLKQELSPVKCTVTANQQRSCSDVLGHLKHPHFERWQEVKMGSACGEDLLWRVSTVMGDAKTADEWYPYVNVIRDADGKSPTSRQQFESNGQQWVHVSKVQNGDTIGFTPSRFTWLFLDTSARRFEAGKTVYPLEELGRITGLWQTLKSLAAENKFSESQLQAIVALLVAKRDSWGQNSAEYGQLAQTILHTEGLDTVTAEDLTSGRLQTTFELYHRILRQKLREETV
jgi:hypothetical protein